MYTVSNVVFRLPLSPLSVVFLFAGGLLFTVAWLTRRLGTKTQVRKWFFILLVTDGSWALLSIAPLEAGTQQIAFFAEGLRLTASSAAAVAWFSFAVVYRGYESNLTRLRLIALSAPLGIHVLAFMTNSIHGLSIQDLQVSVEPTTTLITYEFGLIYSLATVYALMLVLGGTVIVIEAAVRDPDLYADQAIALFAGSVMPIIGVSLTLFGAITLGSTNLTPALLTITAIGYGYALFRADLLATGPQIAAEGRSIAIDSLEEGFLIVDGTDRIIEANDAAQSLLGITELSGQPFEAVFPSDRTEESDIITFRTDDGTIVEARVTSGTGEEESGVGRVVTLRDVTQQRGRQERLEVLQRILRHNVRNDLSIVQGYARQILSGEETDVDPETAARRILNSSENVLSTAEKVRNIEKQLGSKADDGESVALTALLERRVEHAREMVDEEAIILTDLPAECQINSEKAVLERVIDELLENAIRHADHDEPTIEVSASLGDQVVIRIADDGPGMPEQERNPVLTGTETPLKHSSGLGLWTVRWGVRRLNGDLSIRDRSPRGTVVEIRLPRNP